MARPDRATPTSSKARQFYRELIKARRLALSSGFGINRARTQNFGTLAPYLARRPEQVSLRRTRPVIE